MSYYQLTFSISNQNLSFYDRLQWLQTVKVSFLDDKEEVLEMNLDKELLRHLRNDGNDSDGNSDDDDESNDFDKNDYNDNNDDDNNS